MSENTKKTLKILIVSAVVIALLAGGVFGAVRLYDYNHEKNYISLLNDSGVFSEGEDATNARPQTELYDLILNHFNDPLPEGKTAKKALIVGYDGARAESLMAASDDLNVSGFLMLMQMGGRSYPVFTGGPEGLEQDTSTAAAWASMLTGKWANEPGGHKVVGNSAPKGIEPKTALTRLIEAEKMQNADFIVSWNGHLVNGGKTYAAEAQYTSEQKIDINWQTTKNDNETFSEAKNAVENGRDFVFLVLEHCDDAGHTTGFHNRNKRYQKAFRDSDAMAKQLIDAVMARETYAQEDWLLMITSDHGGKGWTHGGQSELERIVFAVSNKALW